MSVTYLDSELSERLTVLLSTLGIPEKPELGRENWSSPLTSLVCSRRWPWGDLATRCPGRNVPFVWPTKV